MSMSSFCIAYNRADVGEDDNFVTALINHDGSSNIVCHDISTYDVAHAMASITNDVLALIRRVYATKEQQK